MHMSRKQADIVEAKVKSQPLIAVRNVRASARWYQQLLACDSLPEHEHRGSYDRIFCNGQLILQLHAWDEDNHPNLVSADAAPPGHGVILWFMVLAEVVKLVTQLMLPQGILRWRTLTSETTFAGCASTARR